MLEKHRYTYFAVEKLKQRAQIFKNTQNKFFSSLPGSRLISK